jgi:hypothetical protein
VVLIPKYELSPRFCPLHSTPAPCLYCLSPEVATIADKYHKDKHLYFDGFLFQEADLNEN